MTLPRRHAAEHFDAVYFGADRGNQGIGELPPMGKALPPVGMRGMIAGITMRRALPPEVCDQIVSRTDGVPLFVKELTKAVPESGLLRDIGDRYELIGPLPPRTIPATLHGSLLARLASDGPDLRNVHHRIPAISASHSDRPNRKEDPIGRSKGRIGAG